MKKIKVLGHRGCAGLEPENTILAFKRATDLGVDLVEFDVRTTKDNRLVVIHDAKVDRTTNGVGYVKDFTFDQIRKLDADKGEKIPSLEEVIDLLKNQKPTIVIEIKEPDSLGQVLKIIKQEGVDGKVIMVSFWHNILKEVKEIEPKIKTGAIFSGRPVETVSLAKRAKTKILCLRYDFLDEEVIKKCHANNVEINAWTVNEVEDIERAIKLKVDIISSDYPDRVFEKLGMQNHLTV